MQDIHAIGGGGGGRFFGGGGDRRLRPYPHPSPPQALKCPRCDSLNTKFCYYNNYNQSQPRHFCKSCRRYWTKGGVLRNVPVGGGCRKAKRSSKPKSSAADAPPREGKTNSHSSSESSSLTASTTTLSATAATADLASASSSTSAVSTLFNFPDSRFFNFSSQTTNPSFDPSPPLIDLPSDGGIFPEIGSFTSMMISSNDPSLLGFNIGGGISASEYRLQQHSHEPVLQNQCSNHDLTMQEEIGAGFLDQTAQMDLLGMEDGGNNGGLGALDWQASGDQGIFDLTGTVDQTYWSQTQWADGDHPLYLP